MQVECLCPRVCSRLGDVNINANTSSIPAKILLYSTAAVFLTLGMKAIATILVPVFYSLFVFLIFAPLVHLLQRKGVPGMVSVFLVILFFIFAFIGTAILVAGSLLQLSSLIPSYENQLTSILDNISKSLPAAGVSVESVLRNIASFTFNLTAGILTGALNAGSTIALIIITTTFLLLDTAGAPKKVKTEIEEGQSFLVLRVTEFGRGLVNYMVNTD